jgi:hypothetical protein
MKFFHRHAANTKIHIGFNGVGHTTFCGFESRFAEDFPTDFRRAKDGRIEYSRLGRRYGLEAFGASDMECYFCKKCLKMLMQVGGIKDLP